MSTVSTVRRSVILVAALAVLLAACGEAGPVPVGPGDTGSTLPPSAEPSPDASASPTPDSSGSGGDTVTLQVWFTRDGLLFETRRTIPSTQAVGAAAMNLLMDGPTPDETAAGVGTAVPGGTEFLGLSIEDGTAAVDLSSRFESGGGSLSVSMRLAQVVYTLTQFRTVDRVTFLLDGQPVKVFSGEGLVIDHPVDRDSYLDLFPTILVESPMIGQGLSGSVTVSGVSNVFEANMTVQILDRSRNVIAQDFTTATCGTGCWGTYSLRLTFDVGSEQPGTIRVTDDDAAGTGTPPHIVDIPVILAP